jgi:hypothetical protein
MAPTDDYISREEVSNYFWEKALKSRWNDTILFINIKDELLKLPSLPDKSLQIREMIERKIEFDPQDEFSCWYKKMWEELLSEIDSLTN